MIDILTRIFSDMFPAQGGNVSTYVDRAEPPESATVSPKPDGLRVIGQGDANETHISIGGVPHLFVDEGGCIVQFVPAFDELITNTPFGPKVLPELAPHWAKQKEHRCTLKDAIAASIRSAGNAVPASSARSAAQNPTQFSAQNSAAADMDAAASDDPPSGRPTRRSGSGSRTDAIAMGVAGTITGWGEERFPNRRPDAKSAFYKSFAMRLETLEGERVLQGEGLKDAISESGCKVGDVVTVRKLRKIKVPAFHKSGEPKIVNGQQLMWDKWLWSINH